MRKMFERQFWLPKKERRPLRYFHVSKAFRQVEGRLMFSRGVTYNSGHNAAKRLKRARRAARLL
jgi:hypothetical protein